MVNPEGNSPWTRNLYGEGKIVQDQFNNEYDNNLRPGVQAAIRNIMHSRETAQLLITGSALCTPSGSYSYSNVGSGYIMTRDSDGLSRIVAIAASTGLDIDAVTKCIVASNDGTSSVKEKASVLASDVILACRGVDDLVDVRNLKTEDDTIKFATTGLRMPSTIVLGDGDSLADAITALGGAGTIILLPGTYTGNVTLSSSISIMGVGYPQITGYVAITSSTAIIEIRGCSFVNSSDHCIKISGNVDDGWRVSIIDCKFTVAGDYDAINQVHGTLTNTAILVIERCNVTATSGDGFVLDNVSRIHISDCNINAEKLCIYISGTNSSITFVSIDRCVMTPNNETAGFGVQITDNVMASNGNVSVVGCRVSGKFVSGIYTGGSAAFVACCDVNGTNVSSVSVYGIYAYSGYISDCRVVNNTVTKMTNGIYSIAVVTGCYSYNAVNAIAGSPLTVGCFATGTTTHITSTMKHANVENGAWNATRHASD